MAHRKRVSAYRRQGVSAFAYLLKLTSANRSRFTFCFPQNAKGRNFIAAGDWERIGGSAGGGSSIHLRFRVQMRDFEQSLNLLNAAPKRFGFSTSSPFQKNESQRSTPTPSPSSPRRHADTPTRQYVSPDLPSGPY